MSESVTRHEINIEAQEARIEQAGEAIRDALAGNAAAAAAYLFLRKLYAGQVIHQARAALLGDESGEVAAKQDAATVTRAARALLIGLGVQTDQPTRAVHTAAFLLTDEAFDACALVTDASAELCAVYLDDAPADGDTLRAAPHRIVEHTNRQTAYLFTLSDHRQFCQRTGRTPRVLIR